MEMTKDRAARATDGAGRLCPRCGAKVFADASSRYCPACLLETGLNLLQDEPQREPVLAQFGDYELLEEIGRGGQGVVYRARQKSLNRTVALKVIALGHWATETHLKRFRREAEAAASLEHPRIVPIYEIGEREGACYFSMKFDGGRPARSARQRAKPIPLRRAAEIIASLARTVQYAHERGILHRDIKPGNVLLDAEGEPHLADFGLARLVETESTVTRTMRGPGHAELHRAGTSRREKARSSRARPTSTGSAPFSTNCSPVIHLSPVARPTKRSVWFWKPNRGNPRLWNPKVDRDLTTICLKCLEKDPQRRYPSALALAEDLERWLRHEPIQARRTGIFTRRPQMDSPQSNHGGAAPGVASFVSGRWGVAFGIARRNFRRRASRSCRLKISTATSKTRSLPTAFRMTS